MLEGNSPAKVLLVMALASSGSAAADELAFKCTMPDWKSPYYITVDTQSKRGTISGRTEGGDPFQMDAEVEMTPANMRLRPFEKKDFRYAINRSTLAFSIAGSPGKCALIPVKKTRRQF